MQCPKCKTNNPGESVFCAKCGTQISETEEKPLPTQTIEAPREELTTGSTFAGRYQIIEELGKGGMGRVYKAEDTELKEKVALKLIKPEISADKKTVERFQNELKFARKIVHKNVGRMYDLGKEEGSYYITMEYVEGQDLKGMVRQSKQLTIGTAISIAKQVSKGLEEAHRLGVIHRDLKPSNVMIDKDGNARIMDFGIARSMEGKGITGAGVMIGTPEYMPPEQAEAKKVDQRSDIYSLGVILYEMVTGRVPFEGDTALSIAMMHKGEAPKDPKEYNAQIPEDLSRVILRCMEKDKGNRYQSAGELRSELENIEKGIPTTEREVPQKKPLTSKEITVTFGLKKLLIPTLAVIVVAIAAVIVWQLLPEKETLPPQPDLPSIAVLPFVDLSPQKDQEHFCDGMTDEIISKLSRINGWKVMNRTSMMLYKNSEKDPKEIGQELGVATILEGSVRMEKDNIRISTQLINVKDGFQIWSNSYDRKLESVFIIQNDIAENITYTLKKELSPEEREQLQKRPTENLEAYNLYLQGLYFWNKRTEEGLKKGIEYFQQAIDEDPDYALAYVGLADCYLLMDWYDLAPPKEVFPEARAAVERALEIDEGLAEAHTSLGEVMFMQWDWRGAEREYRRGIELNPSYATAHHWLGYYLALMGRHDESLLVIKRALELDPLSLIINTWTGVILYSARQYDQAIQQLQKTLELDPEFSVAHNALGWTYIQKGMLEEAIAEFQKAQDLSKGNSGDIAALAHAYAVAGKREEALKVLEELKKISKQHYVSATNMAWISTGLGENDQALVWLEKAFHNHESKLIVLKVDPRFDSLRDDPKFKELIQKMRLED